MRSWFDRWRAKKSEGADPAPAAAPGPAPAGSSPPSPRATGAPHDVTSLGAVLYGLEHRGERLPAEAVAALGLALVEALRAAPGTRLNGAMPNDVLLTRAGPVRLRLRVPPEDPSALPPLTYLSPDAAAGRPLDERSDVYSVCALLFVAACGRAPIAPQHSAFDFLQALVGGPRDPLGGLRPDLPPALASAVDRGLAAVPASRPQTLAALEAALTPLAGAAGEGRALLRTFAFERHDAPPLPVPLPTGSDSQLLLAISGGDEAARLVYADVLEERGLPHHAAWLRLEAEAQRASDSERGALTKALRQLRPRLDADFVAAVGRAGPEGCVFAFTCPMRWEQLTPTPDARVRFCENCSSTVTFFDDLGEARRAAEAGACVALERKLAGPGPLKAAPLILGRLAPSSLDEPQP
ncbi:MAG: TIGR02996 domain-containing protein [Myxococcaceae bacterium]|jgi:uncharacterized protein (TIGR02996 family)|nr:TIGR02996 domain-containing protein [Myxococcaceae bacterium]MCA3017012.1 TIGR02996 domain-containing protein [Myxococcaceae bacterium]